MPHPANAVFRALGAIAAQQKLPIPKLELDWRGKSVRLLTPDEVCRFAEWAYREIDRLRKERDGYLGRAITAERCSGYDTREERDMDLGDRIERLARD